MFKIKEFVKPLIKLVFIFSFLYSCVGSSSVGVFGSGVRHADR